MLSSCPERVAADRRHVRTRSSGDRILALAHFVLIDIPNKHTWQLGQDGFARQIASVGPYVRGNILPSLKLTLCSMLITAFATRVKSPFESFEENWFFLDELFSYKMIKNNMHLNICILYNYIIRLLINENEYSFNGIIWLNFCYKNCC